VIITMSKKVRRHLDGPGFTIPMAAKRLGWEHVVRQAVARREISAITISGLPRIASSELERLEGIFGSAKSESDSDLPAEPSIETSVPAKTSERRIEPAPAVRTEKPATLTDDEIVRLRGLLQQSQNSTA
jgi:hypothetical protein